MRPPASSSDHIAAGPSAPGSPGQQPRGLVARRGVIGLAGDAAAVLAAAALMTATLAAGPGGSPSAPAQPTPRAAAQVDQVEQEGRVDGSARTAAGELRMAMTADVMGADGALVSKAAGAQYSLYKWRGRLTRWNPCAAPYAVKVSTPGLRKSDRGAAVSEAKWAVRQLRKESGIRFVFAGKTREIPSGKAEVKSADIVISYVKPAQARSFPLKGNTIGYGGAWWDGRGARRHGFVVIDTPQSADLPLTRDGGLSRPSILMHELGHVVGLNHVRHRGEQMYPAVSVDSPKTYAAGDRKGLAKIGGDAGCIR